MKRIHVNIALFSVCALFAATASGRTVKLSNSDVTLCWKSGKGGWQLSEVSADGLKAKLPTARHTVLYSADKPSTAPLAPAEYGCDGNFPEPQYRYVIPSWQEATTAVALNRAGENLGYLPENIEKIAPGHLRMTYAGPAYSISEDWRLADDSHDVEVTVSLTAGRDGWYSIATPSLCASGEEDVDFALIPGVLHGHKFNSDFAHAYAYGWGIPAEPVLYRERSTSTLTSMLTSKSGLTVAVTAEPGTAAGPWGGDKRTKDVWRLGLSAMNRDRELTPTLYHPVLGEDGSYMKAGEKREFSFRYTLGKSGWWTVFNHVVNDIYRFKDGLDLRTNRRSLTDRLHGIHRYVVNDSTSKWHTVTFEGDTIGAQEYLGGVYKAQKDAMKNADYGAMWMLGAMTSDPLLTQRRLPYALNFKTRQQSSDPGFMQGASRGQYYLQKSGQFVEEWGPYTEPVATTYYMLMDLGNIALFEPDNETIRKSIRDAADRLTEWQEADGSWAVAYDNDTHAASFTDLKDYRPTFYGLVIAYRILGDKKYLEAARRGADWLIANAVDTDCWLGVCGDTRFAADFATAQSAQALLELSELCGNNDYRDAAIRTARFYTTSVYTNPMASRDTVTVRGRKLEDWQINQSGLSYEHGGIIGSTNLHGPILLASHAGMFVRMYGMTGDRMFLDMARAAAIGRDAHVDDATAVASYYWEAMNKGAGPYPHHAWWQMGWITDYLMAELELRSGGDISFPAGFITPKVGPHRTYAFAKGSIYGEPAQLMMRQGALSCDNPNIETLLARGDNNLYIMIMNDVDREQKASLTADAQVLGNSNVQETYDITLPAYGLKVIKIPYEK